jgi:hypothetical protein
MLWLLLYATLLTGQDPHQSMNERGAMVMGFDQEKTTHHFHLYPDGGAIDVVVKDSSDLKDRDAIRTHLPHIAAMFGDGDFEAPMLVHDSANVPGTAVLKARRAALRYTYVETPAGGRVDIVTTDSAALAALHDFLRYQIVEHQTNDPTTITTRR